MNLSANWILKIDPGVLKTAKHIPQHDAEVIFFGNVFKQSQWSS